MSLERPMEVFARLPKITGWKEIVLNKQPTTDIFEGDVPMEVQDYAKQVLGDGNARMSVSADYGMKSFGNGAGGGVTVSMSCNQDVQTMANVHQFISQWAVKLARQHTEAAYAEYLQMKAAHPEFQ